MNRTRAVLLLLCLLAVAVHALHWETDFETARARAASNDTPLLLKFSGSDWDGWSMTLDEQVFDTRTFESFADEHLVCMLVDFPQDAVVPRSLRDQNTQLRETYQVDELPTIVLVNAAGVELGRAGYRDGGALEYVRHLRALIARGMQATTSAAARAAAAAKHEDDGRTWTNARGVTLVAHMVTATVETVTLRSSSGKEVTVPRASLSQFDNDYIDATISATGPALQR